MQMRDAGPSEAVDALAGLFDAGPVAILTGAGVSTDSGIPDYRGAGSPPRNPMRIDQFLADEAYRRRFWAGARVGALRLGEVAPNAGHLAIARLERAGLLTGVVTQNVDGLHGEAGAVNVVELHGSGATIRCVPEGHRYARSDVLRWFDLANPGFAERHAAAEITPDGDADVGGVAELDGVRVPHCPACGGVLRPDVVYFGEHVPREVFARAEAAIASASGLLIAGSSLAVNTGMRLVHRAERRDLAIAAVNRGPTAVDRRPSLRVRVEGGTTETLTALAERLGV